METKGCNCPFDSTVTKHAQTLVCHNKWEEGATGTQWIEVRDELNTTKKGSVSCTVFIPLKNLILIL